jgi:putative phosphonate transport system ATP-binding protein
MIATSESPILKVKDLSFKYAQRLAFEAISFDLYPGEIIALVGESGCGKTTLLRCLSGQLMLCEGNVFFQTTDKKIVDIWQISEANRRLLSRSQWGFVHQNPRDGLRLDVSAGANIAERLMSIGARHYGNIRQQALQWMSKVELDVARIDESPLLFSGGMQQRLQIARNLVTQPRLVLMDEPTAGLDLSVQARLLDLLKRLTMDLGLSALIVTHDIAVARLLAHRTLVMHSGSIVESGLTDQVLDDPQHPYTQLLVSATLPV